MSEHPRQSAVLAQGLRGYQTAIGQAYAPMVVDPELPGDAYEWSVSGQRCGPLSMSRILASGRICARIQRDADSDDGRKVILTFVENGSFEFEQRGRRAVCGPHSVVLMDIGRALDARQSGALEILSLIMPAKYLRSRIRQFDEICTEAVPAAVGTAAILRDLMKSSWREGGALDLDEGRTLPGLYAGLIETVFVRKDAGGADSQLAALHRRIQALIMDELQNPALSPRMLAARLGISTSYLFTIARRFGTSVRETIIDRRLEACRQDLSDAAWSRRTITEIAFRWGFQDVSHFSHRFSQRFGVSPRRYREMQCVQPDVPQPPGVDIRRS